VVKALVEGRKRVAPCLRKALERGMADMLTKSRKYKTKVKYVGQPFCQTLGLVSDSDHGQRQVVFGRM
jgi:hypothetical protein